MNLSLSRAPGTDLHEAERRAPLVRSMQRAARLFVLASCSAALASCRPTPRPLPANPASSIVLRAFSAASPCRSEDAVACESEKRVLVQWIGHFDMAGQLFAVIDEAGYAGMIRPRRDGGPCSHCPGPEVEADLIAGRGPSRRSRAVAVGPIDTPPVHASIRSFDVDLLHATSSEWRVTLEVDLDGDHRPEIEWITRCAHPISSPCSGPWCLEQCGATRLSRSPSGEVFDVDCGDGIPDVPDCEPDAH
jgi:hypothetical protein